MAKEAKTNKALEKKIAALPFAAILIHRVKNWNDKKRDGMPDSDQWLCILDGEEFRYSKGCGLRKMPKSGYGVRGWDAKDAQRMPKTVYECQRWAEMSIPEPPTANDLLFALCDDAMSYEGAVDLDDFAEEFGYTRPSEAIKAYESCKQAYVFLNERFDRNERLDIQEQGE